MTRAYLNLADGVGAMPSALISNAGRLYATRAEADQACSASAPPPGKEFHVSRVESGHWGVFWRWQRVPA
jgi:hypothetical protein